MLPQFATVTQRLRKQLLMLSVLLGKVLITDYENSTKTGSLRVRWLATALSGVLLRVLMLITARLTLLRSRI
jgi:hypothetical protein